MPRLMFISCSDYDELCLKGVAGMIAERSEGGFFARVTSLHLLAKKTRLVPIELGHDLYELGFDGFPGGSHILLLRFFYAPFYLIGAIRKTINLVRSERINIVRASDPFISGLVGWITARITGASFCVSVHADYHREENRDLVSRMPLAFSLAKFILRRADVVAPISQYLACQIRGYGVKDSRIHVIYHGIDVSLFRDIRLGGLRAKFDLPSDSRIVLFVNRLSNQKFCWDALKIARLIRAKNVVTVFCGDGPERSDMEKFVKNDPILLEKVRFLGFQPRELIALLAAEADIGLVLLAGFGLIEMCASGLPVVVYEMEWQGEIIQHEKNGLISRVGDIQGVADSVDRLLSDRSLAEALGAAAREDVVSKFSLEAARIRRINAYRASMDLINIDTYKAL